MNTLPSRRFQKKHEQILLSSPFLLLVGWLVSVVLPTALHWGWRGLLTPDLGQKTALIVTSIAFLISHIFVRKINTSYPGGQSSMFIAPQVTTVYVLIALLSFLLTPNISRFILLSSGAFALFWFYLAHFCTLKYRRLKLAIIKGGMSEHLFELDNVDARALETLDLQGVRYDAVVADFNNLNKEDERFLTQCALNRIPVYDASLVYESLSGRVRINRMSENNLGALLPTKVYESTKLLMDLSIVLLSLPIVLPLGLITALLIKLESPGPAIYTQQRIGLGNKEFTIYKFRSMRFDREQAQQFAGEDDPRITRIGRIIRKLRIDELPQFLNIIKGEMSLIGPRPEQPNFVREFDEKIPFYNYRHVVKPGITGWAQVRQGYTADADATRIKIEHDFYYIKNCSTSLDLHIVFLTIKTMLTGFGAR
ncbi:sugar transferase [Alcaligenes faecalis]|uniref:exopolysaccharide biosynthesis polyprenyl glycosylphosphotransferase n=1 Tax=Alcaligenes faecalis TaxID=511 RepID=UPI0012933C83|nr:exopolysaccharide biosynthesis polyprenyl glycosylphosphotransferase [Alcaligenes faecalis]MBX6962902.1 exopolysaccharide biosynthesis polyprenyl glycosylphosphotransferase [Providencia rettgeri]MBX7032228.1 exopolysaccharide biosynthesis polyprenyl glycosylphosphotransferase [Alcaligenes faecalis]QFY79253.1 sugar transferase [Alcaligenes faecalis]